MGDTFDAEARARRHRAHDEEGLIPAPGNVCPRCFDDVPVPGQKGIHHGARSRTDNLTEVCDRCGGEEAYLQAAGKLTPQTGWPIVRAPQILMPRSATTWETARASRGEPMMPYPGPSDLPDLRLHLLDRWQEGGPFERMSQMPTVYAAAASATERLTLQSASLWWVKEDMVTLTEAAARSTPEDVKGYEVKLPAGQKRGLVVLEQPWVGTDALVADHMIRVHAFTWLVNKIENTPCISLTLYEYIDFGAGLDAQELKLAADTGVLFEGRLENTKALANAANFAEMVGRLRGGSWVVLGRSDWPLKETLGSFDVFLSDPVLCKLVDTEQARASMIEDRKFFAAFSTLVNHKLSNVDENNVPRYVRRRAERAGHPMKEPSLVRLVRLRESTHRSDRDPDAEKKHVEWSHRWLVDGHMAWRACGPNRSQRRLVFVVPHIKGPKDMPLVIKSTVRTWVR